MTPSAPSNYYQVKLLPSTMKLKLSIPFSPPISSLNIGLSNCSREMMPYWKPSTSTWWNWLLKLKMKTRITSTLSKKCFWASKILEMGNWKMKLWPIPNIEGSWLSLCKLYSAKKYPLLRRPSSGTPSSTKFYWKCSGNWCLLPSNWNKHQNSASPKLSVNTCLTNFKLQCRS